MERRGADLRDPLWSAKLLIENPALIREIHEDYFRAGADVGTSASYQASFLGFARRGIEPRRAAELMRLSVRLVQDARDRFWDVTSSIRTVPCLPPASGGEGRGEGGQNPTREQRASASDTGPPHPYPSPPEAGGEGTLGSPPLRDNLASESSPAARRQPLVAASIGCYGATLHDGSEY